MNHKKFISLLNLYIDGEISPADATSLELEVQSSAERRAIYNDYCRIHRATKVMFEQFRNAGGVDGLQFPAQAGAGPRDRLTGGSAVRPFRAARLWIGSGAAAACVAAAVLAISISSRQSVADNTSPASDQPLVASHEPAAVVVKTQVNPIHPTYAAPFVADTRADPYVFQTATTVTDPFSMKIGGNDSFVTTPFGSTANIAPIVPISDINVSGPSKLKHTATGQPLFHTRSDSKDGPFEPVTYQVNP